MSIIEVEYQMWARFPKVLIVTKKDEDGTQTTRRYVPERTCEVERIERNNPDRFDDYFVVLTCGCWFDWPDATPPVYCPNCGAKVVER